MRGLYWECIVLLITLFVLCVRSEVNDTAPPVHHTESIYSATVRAFDVALPYRWDEVHVTIKNSTSHQEIRSAQSSFYVSLPVADMIKQPVYVSIATMSSRIHQIHKVVLSYLHGLVRPTKIFVFISRHPFLIDEGIPLTSIPPELLALAAAKLVSIVYTQNLGPHRKLLPLLRHFRNKDVVIATVDDDWLSRTQNVVLYLLLQKYKETAGKHVVALRPRRIGLCRTAEDKVTKYEQWSVINTPDVTEMLVVPTGTGGILYRPRFFHEVVFNHDLWLASLTTDDFMFRLTTMARNISVAVGCRPLEHSNRFVRICPVDADTQRLITPRVKEAYRLRNPNGVLPARFNVTHRLLQNLYGKNFDQPPTPGNGTRVRLAASGPAASDLTTSVNDTGTMSTATRRLNGDKDHHRHHLGAINDAVHAQQAGSDSNSNSTAPRVFARRAKKFSLFLNNSKGGNDWQWAAAVKLLNDRGFMDLRAVLRQYRGERPASCYDASAEPVEIPGGGAFACSLSDCEDGEINPFL
jgi:hypothetical protein